MLLCRRVGFDFEQNQEHLKEFKLIDKSELNQCLFPKHLVAECCWRNSLDPRYNLFILYLKLKRQSKSLCYTKWRKTVQNTFKCSYHLKINLRVSMNLWSKLHVAVSHWFSDWILELSQPSSYSKKMPIKFQFYNPIVQRTTQFKKFGLIINHAK